MSAFRSRFLFALVLLPGMLAGSASAQDVNRPSSLRDWAVDVIRGDESLAAGSRSEASAGEGVDSMTDRFIGKAKGFLGQLGGLIDQRIGWLRPTSAKELALIWLSVAMALPWGFVGWLRPLLRHDNVAIRWIVVAIWSGLIVWLGWCSWGQTSGADRFTSTMLIGVPMLVIYFNSIVRSFAVPGKV